MIFYIPHEKRERICTPLYISLEFLQRFDLSLHIILSIWILWNNTLFEYDIYTYVVYKYICICIYYMHLWKEKYTSKRKREITNVQQKYRQFVKKLGEKGSQRVVKSGSLYHSALRNSLKSHRSTPSEYRRAYNALSLEIWILLAMEVAIDEKKKTVTVIIDTFPVVREEFRPRLIYRLCYSGEFVVGGGGGVQDIIYRVIRSTRDSLRARKLKLLPPPRRKEGRCTRTVPVNVLEVQVAGVAVEGAVRPADLEQRTDGSSGTRAAVGTRSRQLR